MWSLCRHESAYVAMHAVSAHGWIHGTYPEMMQLSTSGRRTGPGCPTCHQSMRGPDNLHEFCLKWGRRAKKGLCISLVGRIHLRAEGKVASLMAVARAGHHHTASHALLRPSRASDFTRHPRSFGTVVDSDRSQPPGDSSS